MNLLAFDTSTDAMSIAVGRRAGEGARWSHNTNNDDRIRR